MMVVIRVSLLVGLIASFPKSAPELSIFTNDAVRYQEIAQHPGRPYRDFEVEFPPLAVGLVHLVAGSTATATAERLGWLMLLCDLGVAGVLALGWGRRAAFSYLLMGAPLLAFVYFRLDLASVLLAILGIFAVRRGRQVTGGLALGAAVLVKLWPVVLLPIFLVQRRWKALLSAVGSLAVATALWVWWAGWRGPIQVLTFRHGRGWEVGSLVASAVHYLSSSAVRFSSGAYRIGSSPPWAQGLLLAALIVASALAWRLVLRAPFRAEGPGALVAVGLLLALSPVFSDQFVAWLLPWAAITVMAGRREIEWLTLAVAGLTTLAAIVPANVDYSSLWPLLLVRNLALIALVWGGFRVLLTPVTVELPFDAADRQARTNTK
jgi:Glycosyltransferase family 87